MMYSADEKKKKEIKILQSNYTDKAVRLDSSHWGKKKCRLGAITGLNLTGEIISTKI